MEGAEFDALVTDIASNGLRQAIWLHPDGSIVDGRNRYRACLKAGREPDFRQWDGQGSLLRFVQAGRMSLQQAKQEIKKQQKRALVEQIKREPPPLPEGPFRTIVIDPPWPCDCSRAPYPAMTIHQIKSLPVPELAHEDCVLWLWITNSLVREAFECLDAWGFRQTTMLTWAKDRVGVGSWLRGETEHCLLTTRGRPVVTLTDQGTLLMAPRREHSRKPDEFYEVVESLCPGNKLEMFARQPREGWQSWGAETNLFAVAS